MRVSLAGVAKSYGAQPVLDRVDLTLGAAFAARRRRPERGRQVDAARLLAGIEEPDGGRVERDAGHTHARGTCRRSTTADRARRCSRTSHAAPVSPPQTRKCSDTARLEPGCLLGCLERYLALGGADLEHRARTVCAELGLPVSLDQETTTLSGGEAARAALAAILLSRFDLLLLDEPTNDLDFAGLELLERFLAGFQGGLAVVSHDRAFLDRTVDRIAEIDPWMHTVREFAGGWTEYESARELARSRQYEAFERSQERRREVEALLNERRSQARATGGFLAKATGGADRRGTHALKTKVRQAEKALERVEDVDKPYEPWRLQLSSASHRRPATAS